MKKLKVLKYLILIFAEVFNSASAQNVSTLASKISPARIEALTMDKFGNLYSPSGPQGIVYKINRQGEVSTFASGLNFPQGGTTDHEGNFYVSNWNSGVITKISHAGEKSTFLTGFKGPTGLTFSKDGKEIYVCNYSSNSISKISLNTNSETVYAFGNGINGPDGIVFDDDGNLYIANFNNNLINKINSNGEISKFAELPGSNSGYITYAQNYIYVSGHRSHKIYKISLTGEISEVAGTGVPGFKDGVATQAQFNLPNGIATSFTGDTLFISDADNKAIRIVDLSDNATDIGNINYDLPNKNILEQNFPNPFNPTTRINYSLERDYFVSLKIYNSVGEEISILENGYKTAGKYSKLLNARNLTSGIYFYTLSTGSFSQTRKLLLIK